MIINIENIKKIWNNVHDIDGFNPIPNNEPWIRFEDKHGISRGMQLKSLEAILNLIKDFNLKTILEVGVFRGSTAYIIKKFFPTITYIGIENGAHISATKNRLNVPIGDFVLNNKNIQDAIIVKGNYEDWEDKICRLFKPDLIILDDGHETQDVLKQLKIARENHIPFITVQDTRWISVKNAIKEFLRKNDDYEVYAIVEDFDRRYYNWWDGIYILKLKRK